MYYNRRSRSVNKEIMDGAEQIFPSAVPRQDADGLTNHFPIYKVLLATVSMKLRAPLLVARAISPGGLPGLRLGLSSLPELKQRQKKPPTSAAFNLEGVNHVKQTDGRGRTSRNPPPSHTLFCCPPLTEAEGSGFSSGQSHNLR